MHLICLLKLTMKLIHMQISISSSIKTFHKTKLCFSLFNSWSCGLFQYWHLKIHRKTFLHICFISTTQSVNLLDTNRYSSRLRSRNACGYPSTSDKAVCRRHLQTGFTKTVERKLALSRPRRLRKEPVHSTLIHVMTEITVLNCYKQS